MTRTTYTKQQMIAAIDAGKIWDEGVEVEVTDDGQPRKFADFVRYYLSDADAKAVLTRYDVADGD